MGWKGFLRALGVNYSDKDDERFVELTERIQAREEEKKELVTYRPHMDLQEKLKAAVLDDLKAQDFFFFKEYANKHKYLMMALYEGGIIDDEGIESSLEIAALKKAREDYKTMTREGNAYTIYPDHIHRPSIFAYGIMKGIFNEEELAKVPFDHGDTAENMAERYHAADLLANLREELLHPKPLPKYDNDGHDHVDGPCTA
ncbi:hypothetical protein ACFL96_17635 [Thermoproteota archaeon]